MLSRPIRQEEHVDEAEKPFWISYADLMTSMMVLFLIVMITTLLAIVGTISELNEEKERAEVLSGKYTALEKREGQRSKDIDEFWTSLRTQLSKAGVAGVSVDSSRNVIDFGDRARFAQARFDLNVRQTEYLRRVTEVLLAQADRPIGKKVVRRVVVEGFASPEGTYLGNLDLSLRRSESVLCALLAPGGPSPLSGREKQRVRDLFLVGGYSSNASKVGRNAAEASRRVELRVEFLNVGQKRPVAGRASSQIGPCAQ